MRKEKLLRSCFCKLLNRLDKIWYAALTWWSVLMLNFVRMIGIQGRELKHVFMIFCRFDACEAVSFKLDMVIDMTKLYVMKAV